MIYLQCRNKNVIAKTMNKVILLQKCIKRYKVTCDTDLVGAYQPKTVEDVETQLNYFSPKITSNKPFTMILPPPNITGNLHLGHALTATIQDVIIRWKRLQGIETLWIPGLDHAGIATQVVVEKRLWKEQHKTRHDIGREAFEREVWNWKEEKSNLIEEQLKMMGTLLNWSNKVFTMDSDLSQAVNIAFIRLFESGLIYRGQQLVNWSCALQSAISDIEVDHIEIDGATSIFVPGYDKPIQFGKLTYFAYKLHETDDEEIVVATTRPETILGDVAVAVNPNDNRYNRFIGRNVWHPFRKQTIPIIGDNFVDSTFGTGAVKVTPAHDHTDYEVGIRHNLTSLSVIDEQGNISLNCSKEFAGLKRFHAREKIQTILKELNLLRDSQNHKMIIPICSRSKDIIEFLIKPQWFIKCDKMAAKAAENVRLGHLIIEPKQFEKTWFNWLENIRDWCVSRQLWWGHRIPIYSCWPISQPNLATWIAAENFDQARLKAETQFKISGHKIEIRQDDDVLDTWFSSALLPFTSLGWPEKLNLQNYPLSLMETGHDILFFWVARMVMLGNELTGCLPFKNILLHGIIRDGQGRKMSKSLGNVIAPEDVINGATLEDLENRIKLNKKSGSLDMNEMNEAIKSQKKMFPNGIPECGADALRFTLCSHNIKNSFINFDIQECNANKLFCNKIWQATKYTNHSISKMTLHEDNQINVKSIEKLNIMDRWILSRLANMFAICENAFEQYEFYLAADAIKNFLYFEFCDIYLETTKRGLKLSDEEISIGHCWTLWHSLDISLKTISPFMPQIAQHLHKKLIQFPNTTKNLQLPNQLNYRNKEVEAKVDNIMAIVVVIRRLKQLFKIGVKHNSQVYIIVDFSKVKEYDNFKEIIKDLTLCSRVNITSSNNRTDFGDTISDRVGNNIEIHLQINDDLRRTIDIDSKKLESKKLLLLKDLDKMTQLMSNDNYTSKITDDIKQNNAKKMEAFRDKLTRINYIQSFCKK